MWHFYHAHIKKQILSHQSPSRRLLVWKLIITGLGWCNGFSLVCNQKHMMAIGKLMYNLKITRNKIYNLFFIYLNTTKLDFLFTGSLKSGIFSNTYICNHDIWTSVFLYTVLFLIYTGLHIICQLHHKRYTIWIFFLLPNIMCHCR